MPLKLYILGIYITKALGPSLKQPFWQPSDDLTTTLRQISIVAVERNFYPVPTDGLQNTNYFKFTISLKDLRPLIEYLTSTYRSKQG